MLTVTDEHLAELDRLIAQSDAAVNARLDAIADELALAPARRCRVCLCSDERACPGGCTWVGADLCSRCA